MRGLIFLIIFGLFMSIPIGVSANEATGQIIVDMTGFRSNEGEVKAVLYNSEDGYPGSYDKAVQIVSGSIVDSTSQVIFTVIPVGDYALEILHDENSNGLMDTNWLKMPKEGYGFSNNAKGLVGPPSFDKAKFHLGSDELTMTIKMDYL